MINKNASLEEKSEYSENSFDFDELEEKLESQLELELSELELLREEINGSSDNLGENIKKIIWEQFTNQIAVTAGEDFIKENNGLMNLRDEAHIQTAENFEKGKIANHNTKIDYQERYNEWENSFVKGDKRTLTKETRKEYDQNREKGSATVHKDHTISVAEITRDIEAATHLSKEEKIEFANSDKNLKDLDASANMSKSDKTMSEWLDSERNGEKPSERFNINEDKLRERDKEARENYKEVKEEGKKKSIEMGKESKREEAFLIGGKALRAIVMQLLAELVKEIIGKLIKWLKSTGKNLESLLLSIKKAVGSFVEKMKTHLINASKTLITTIMTAIIGPVIDTIKKVWVLLKQGWKSLKEAINYIRSAENKGKSINQLLPEVGKIIIAGLSATGAILLSEVIEKGLMTIPIFAIQIPLLGNLANILGVFMGAVVSGVIGAIAIKLIQKIIENKHRKENIEKKIDKGNEIMEIQHQIQQLNEDKLVIVKEEVVSTIKERHAKSASSIKESLENIFGNETEESNNKDDFDEINALLDELLE